MGLEHLIGTALSLGLLAFLVLRQRRGAAEVTVAVEQERQRSWDATVTGRQIQNIAVGRHGTVQHLTVTYRRDDGVEGNVQAYERDVMRSKYLGALAYYREAPPFNELTTWEDGARLHKPVGAHFPKRVKPAPA